MPTADLTPEQASMLVRLKVAEAHRQESGSAGWVHVAAECRQEALAQLARMGLAECWEGQGKDAGLLLGKITKAGRARE